MKPKEKKASWLKQDKIDNPEKYAYYRLKTTYKGAWKISKSFFISWAKAVGWAAKKGNKAFQHCISREDHNEDFTKDNIRLKKRSEHNAELAKKKKGKGYNKL